MKLLTAVFASLFAFAAHAAPLSCQTADFTRAVELDGVYVHVYVLNGTAPSMGPAYTLEIQSPVSHRLFNGVQTMNAPLNDGSRIFVTAHVTPIAGTFSKKFELNSIVISKDGDRQVFDTNCR